jgi:regulatory protein
MPHDAQRLPRITAIEPDPYRPGAVRLLVNGATLCTVPASSVEGGHLSVGTSLDESTRAALEQAADVEAAYRTLLRALERRSFARNDLGRRLRRRGHPSDAVEAALDRAVLAGLLDDLAFARNYAESRSTRGRGPRRIRQDLLVMGVAADVIDRVLANEWAEPGRATAVAEALARRRAAQLGDVEPVVKRRRILAYLARRGFTGAEVRALVGRVVDG